MYAESWLDFFLSLYNYLEEEEIKVEDLYGLHVSIRGFVWTYVME